MRNFILLVMVCLVLGSGVAFAQEKAPQYGVILYAQGEEISIQRGSSFRTYDIKKDSVIGLSILENDFIQTGPGTTLEMQLLPAKTYIKIAENTSFKVVSTVKQGGSLEVLYGRVRAKVSALTGEGEGFSIRGKSAVAGVRGTDFGYDVVITQGGAQAPRTNVYCFEGAVAVTATDAKDAEPVLIKQDQIVVVLPAASKEAISMMAEKNTDKLITDQGGFKLISSQTIPDTIQSYWNTNAFQGTKQEEKALKEAFPGLEEQVKQEQDRLLGKAEGKPLQDITSNTENTKAPNIADQLPPLASVNALGSITRDQYVYGSDFKKRLGMVLGGSGFGLALISGITTAFGGDFLGWNAETTTGAGTVGGVTGGLLLGSGVFLYLWGYLEQ